MMRIRKGRPDDIYDIMECYEIARGFMRQSGNHKQWINGYPTQELISKDIDEGICYVGLDEKNEITMVFAFIIGEDPTYSTIMNGNWLNNRTYGTIHRLGSNGKHHGVLKECVDFCSFLINNLRLDTHSDNIIMQYAAETLGFKRCGIIYCMDGSPRIAYQRYLETLE